LYVPSRLQLEPTQSLMSIERNLLNPVKLFPPYIPSESERNHGIYNFIGFPTILGLPRDLSIFSNSTRKVIGNFIGS